MSNDKAGSIIPPEVAAAAQKVISVSHKGTVQLNAPEAEWIMNAVGMTLAQMKAQKDAGKVLLAQQRQFDAQFQGLGVLHQKAVRAFEELIVEYNAKSGDEKGD